MLQNVRIPTFTASELLRENQHGVVKLPPKLRLRTNNSKILVLNDIRKKECPKDEDINILSCNI